MPITPSTSADATAVDLTVNHRRIAIDGCHVFYREAGPPDAPVVLLPHGYPSSSFQFRAFMPALADRWRLIAPDYPGFGYSDTPDRDRFDYTFAGYGRFLERVAALIIQNGDIYEDELGPRYEPLKDYWANPTAEGRAKLAAAVSEEGFRDEFVNEVPDRLIERISPDLWKLAWPLMRSPERREIMIGLMEDLRTNLDWFPRYQAYLRAHRPPTLIVWGPRDGYMPEGAARAYLRDLPDAELHLLDGGHWALETNFDEIVALTRNFLGRLQESNRGADRMEATP